MQTIKTARLLLEPVTAGHAASMFEVLSDPEIYHYLDDSPPASSEHLRSRYARLEARRSPDGSQIWLNWIVALSNLLPIGYVQATVVSLRTARIAYVLSSRYWAQGYAAEAVQAMLLELSSAYNVVRYLATVEAANQRSIRLLERLGFRQGTDKELAGEALSPTECLFIR